MSITEKDLKKLGRTDLLEILIEVSQENERLRAELTECEKQLADRKIILDKSGSIAEASLQLSGIFDAAQKAADEYLANVKLYSESREEVFARILADANDAAQRMINDTKKKCALMEEDAKRNCDQMTRCARKAAESYWDAVSAKYESQSMGEANRE